MRLKRLFGLLFLALGGMVVAQSAEFRAPALPPIQGNVQLEFWTWVPGIENTVKLFEQKYPNVKVKVVNKGGGMSTYRPLQQALRSGQGAPDLAQVEFEFLPSFIDTGKLVDLGKFGAQSVAGFFPSWTWSQVSRGGRSVYGIPQDTGPMGLIYRKDILDRYGIKVPTTWFEFGLAAEQLHKASNGTVKIANFFPSESQSSWFASLVWAAGGKFYQRDEDGSWIQDINSPEAERVLEFWMGLVRKGYVSTLPAFSDGFWKAMSGGQIAMSVEAAWGPGSFASSLAKMPGGEYRVAQLPQWDANRLRTSSWGGSTTVVTAQSKNPGAAAVFAIWLNTYQAALESNWRGGGLFPAANEGLKMPILANINSNPSRFFGGQNVTQVYAQSSRWVSLGFQWAPYGIKFGPIYAKAIDAAVKGRISPTQALAQMQRELLAQARKDGYKVSEP
jgi:multiple sugar transport system substrate-binding protein